VVLSIDKNIQAFLFFPNKKVFTFNVETLKGYDLNEVNNEIIQLNG
jgi:hypothetical protein